MSKQKFSLYVLSLVFLCTDNISGSLFADSNPNYIMEINEEEEEKEFLLSQNQQKPSKASVQMKNEEMVEANCCPEIVEDCCFCSVCPPTEIITPLGGPCVMDGYGFYLTADFIYWTASERGTAIAATTGFSYSVGDDHEPFEFGSFPTGVPSTPAGKVIRFDQPWRPGFKVGLGIDFCHDGWDLGAEYTGYRLKTSKNGSAPLFPNAQSVFFIQNSLGLALWDPYWGINGTNNVIGQNTTFNSIGGTTQGNAFVYGNVNGKWHLQFNAIDLELGRNFYISRRLMLRPHFGLKGSWQQQKLAISLTNGISNLNAFLIFLPIFNSFMTQKMDAWGIGPRAGLDSAWHFSRAFSFIGSFALTGLFEHFSVKRFDYSLFPPTGPNANISNSFVHLDNSFNTVQPVFEWMLGFRLESWVWCDRYHFSLDAGWEEQVWFGQNQFLRVKVVESSEGNLTLAGLTFHARFDF